MTFFDFKLVIQCLLTVSHFPDVFCLLSDEQEEHVDHNDQDKKELLADGDRMLFSKYNPCRGTFRREC